MELIATTCTDDKWLLLELMRKTSFCNLNHRLTSSLTLLVILCTCPYKVILKAIRSHNINLLTEQMLTLASCDIANRKESIVILCALLFDRVLSHNIELTSQVVCIERLQRAIERKIIARNATTHNCCMGAHHCSDIWRMLAQIKTSRACHPLMEVSHSLLGCCAEGINIRLDNLTCQVTKQYRLNIIPLSRDRVYPISLPQLLQHLIFASKKGGEVYKYRNRTSTYIPTTNTNTYSIIIESLSPTLHQHWLLDKLRHLAILRKIWTDSDILITHLLCNGQGFRCQYGMNTTDLVTHLPAHLKEIIWIKFYFTHNYLIICCFISKFVANIRPQNYKIKYFLKFFNNLYYILYIAALHLYKRSYNHIRKQHIFGRNTQVTIIVYQQLCNTITRHLLFHFSAFIKTEFLLYPIERQSLCTT